jgi:hypothetical protein
MRRVLILVAYAAINRQAAARCIDGERNLPVLDSEINAFNDLLATKCGG